MPSGLTIAFRKQIKETAQEVSGLDEWVNDMETMEDDLEESKALVETLQDRISALENELTELKAERE